MDKALISLSFDDGRKDNTYIFNEILWPRLIPATLNVTTGYVDGTCPADRLPCLKPAMNIQNITEIASRSDGGKRSFFEIALHGDQHMNTEEDISVGREKLIRWLNLPEDHIFGFASPGSGLGVQQFCQSKSDLLKKQISYMRTSLRITDSKTQRIFFRKVGRLWHQPFFYQIAYANTLMEICPDRVIYSVPVLKDVTEKQVEALIDLAIKRRMALTLMFHSIDVVTKEDDNWTWSIHKFNGIIDYLIQLRSHHVPMEICTTQDLYERITDIK